MISQGFFPILPHNLSKLVPFLLKFSIGLESPYYPIFEQRGSLENQETAMQKSWIQIAKPVGTLNYAGDKPTVRYSGGNILFE